MRSWLSRLLAAVLCAVCLMPAPLSAYYYNFTMVVTIATGTTAVTISIITEGAIIVTEFGWSLAMVIPDTTGIGEAQN